MDASRKRRAEADLPNARAAPVSRTYASPSASRAEYLQLRERFQLSRAEIPRAERLRREQAASRTEQLQLLEQVQLSRVGILRVEQLRREQASRAEQLQLLEKLQLSRAEILRAEQLRREQAASEAEELRQAVLSSRAEQLRQKQANRTTTTPGNPRAALLNAYADNATTAPVALDNLSPSERAHLHQACTLQNLHHETTTTGALVIGSRQNIMAEELARRINGSTGGRSTRPISVRGGHFTRNYEIGDWRYLMGEESDRDHEIEDRRFEAIERASNPRRAFTTIPLPLDFFDITGHWELVCPDMTACFGQQRPYTLSIFTDGRPLGRQLYGRFDFGAYIGVVRFCKRSFDASVQHNNVGFRLSFNDLACLQKPSMQYCWRGKESGEDMIQLGEDDMIYTMTFSDGGCQVEGTWGTTQSDPGLVNFSGRKVSVAQSYESMDIQSEWDDLSEAAYDQANRDRWRRRY